MKVTRLTFRRADLAMVAVACLRALALAGLASTIRLNNWEAEGWTMGGAWKMAAVWAFLGLILMPIAVSAQMFSGSAQAGDGDSLSVSGLSFRLFGIDAPELQQTCKRGQETWACGEEAKRQLQALVAGRRVSCRGLGQDDFGRTVAICSVPGSELNKTMVASGWAMAFRKYSDSYVGDEDRAKAGGLGIWGSDFVLPEVYRAANAPKVPAPAKRSFAATPSRLASSSSYGCAIKGNHSRKGEWIYHLPGMPYYEQTRAEAMFCSEAEAIAAGYRRSRAGN